MSHSHSRAFARDFAQLLSRTNTLSEAARPLLRALAAMSGLECTFVTRVHPLRRRITVHAAHATQAPARGVVVPEGATCAWEEALCKSLLDEGVGYASDVDARWGDNPAVEAMGVRTYASRPIWDERGHLLGTLCAASRQRVPPAPHAVAVLDLFARLLGHQLERLEDWDDTRRPHFQIRSEWALAEALAAGLDCSPLEAHLRRAAGLACPLAALDDDDIDTENDHGHDHALGPTAGVAG